MTVAERIAWLILAVGGILALGMVVRWMWPAAHGRDPRSEARPHTTAAPPAPAQTDRGRDFVDLEFNLPDDPAGEPATDKQVAALRHLGIAETEGITFRQASLLLSAREYADTLAKRSPGHEHPIARYKLLVWLIATEERRKYVAAWSWRTRNQDSRRMPRDDFRAAAEDFLKDF